MSLKAIAYILSIYLLYLCCYPCAEDNCADDEDQSAFIHTEDEGEKDCSESEACTPFCFDGCCVAHIICEVAYSSTDNTDFSGQDLNFHFSERHIPQHAATIWQPPKI